MRKYELMAVFPLDEEKAKAGADEVRGILKNFGAEIESEDVFGDRDLTYEVKKQKRGRFILFTMKLSPGKITEIDSAFRLQKDLLKYLFVKLDEK